ncbi:MAG: hypothetical protein IJJ55_01095 [Clostridia bacterium]|nr:hypothetical protein [Clostridia bacterium]
MKKTILSYFLSLILAIGMLQCNVIAENNLSNLTTPTVPPRYDNSKFIITNSTIILNGEVQKFSTPTISYQDRTLVPMRELFEKLGTEVLWNGEEQSITAVTPTKNVGMIINNPFVNSGGYVIVVDVPPMLYGDRTVIPLRFVCEQLHLNVQWDGDNNTIFLTSKGDITLGSKTIDLVGGSYFRYYGELLNGEILDGLCELYRCNDGVTEEKDNRIWQFSNGVQTAVATYDDGHLSSFVPSDMTGLYYGPLTTDGEYENQTYLGNMIMGNPDGYGIIEYDSGACYYGNFKNGVKSGEGVYIWTYEGPESAYYYFGEWQNDKENGYGIYVWNDGLYHIGNFKDGRFDGYGTRYFTDGTSQNGYWRNGQYIE